MMIVLLVSAVMSASCGSASTTPSTDGTDVGTSTPRPGSTADSQLEPDDLLAAIDAAPNPATIEYTLDPESARTATIDASGGEITTSFGDVNMRLIIEAGALLEPVDITITPLAEARSGLVDLTLGGVEFAPAGLIFATPARLQLTGPEIPMDVIGVDWETSGAEVSRIAAAPIDGGVELLVAHFSGAGAGSPGSGAGDNVDSNMTTRAQQYAIDGFVEYGDCVQDGTPFGILVDAAYREAFIAQVFPALKQAETNDMVLHAALLGALEWVELPSTLAPLSIICDDLQESLDVFVSQKLDDISASASEGLTHAMLEASRVCAKDRDPGETIYLQAWVAVAQVLGDTLGELSPTNTSGSWSVLMVDLTLRCLVYEVHFGTDLESEAGSGGETMGGSITAIIPDVPDVRAVNLLAMSPGEAEAEATYLFRFPESTASSCTVNAEATIEPVTILGLAIVTKPPRRKVPIGRKIPAPDPASTSWVVFQPLEGDDDIVVTCDGKPFPMPLSGAIPGWFNHAHRNENDNLIRIDLEPQSVGAVVASYERKGTVAALEGKVTEFTEIAVIHTPKPPPAG